MEYALKESKLSFGTLENKSRRRMLYHIENEIPEGKERAFRDF
jgi:hypothetical protein